MRIQPSRNRVKQFGTAAEGSVAIIFSVAAIAVLMIAGVAIDYGRGVAMQSKMQAAADAGVLAAVREATLNSNKPVGQLKTVAREYFDDNLTAAGSISITKFALQEAGEGYRLEVSGKMQTSLMAVAGFNQLDLDVAAQAETGPGRPLEVALALDNTGSMSGTKMTALKDSAHLLVDKLLEDTPDPRSRTKVALVPFNKYVNVGLANRNAPWISVPDDTSETGESCWNTYPNKSGCTTQTSTCYNDGVPYSCQRQSCTSYGDPVEQCQEVTTTQTWRGCVGSRDYPLNVRDESYNFTPVPGLLNYWCSKPITPLTDDKSVISSGIDAMSASSSTYIPAGLTWAWRVLTKPQPYNEGKTQVEVRDEGGIKAVVLMTDGANTMYPSYPKHYSLSAGTEPTVANDLTAELCTNIKTEEITIYTVAFEITDTTIKDLLRDCATQTSYYYDADNPTELSNAFEAIAGQLAQLKLTK